MDPGPAQLLAVRTYTKIDTNQRGSVQITPGDFCRISNLKFNATEYCATEFITSRFFGLRHCVRKLLATYPDLSRV